MKPKETIPIPYMYGSLSTRPNVPVDDARSVRDFGLGSLFEGLS